MNWYKKIIESGNKPTFSPRKFLDKLKSYGVVIERQAAGSSCILLNRTNNKRTDFHYHKGVDVGNDAVRGMLRSLGIDYWEFMGRKTESIEEPEDIQDLEEEIPEWKKQPWHQEQLQYSN